MLDFNQFRLLSENDALIDDTFNFLKSFGNDRELNELFRKRRRDKGKRKRRKKRTPEQEMIRKKKWVDEIQDELRKDIELMKLQIRKLELKKSKVKTDAQKEQFDKRIEMLNRKLLKLEIEKEKEQIEANKELEKDPDANKALQKYFKRKNVQKLNDLKARLRAL